MKNIWNDTCKCTQERAITIHPELGYFECDVCGKQVLPKVGYTYEVIDNENITADFPDDAQFVGQRVKVIGYEGGEHDVIPLITCEVPGHKFPWNLFHVMFDLNSEEREHSGRFRV